MTTILEYVWIGGNDELYSKTKIINKIWLDEYPIWNFDGSSCNMNVSTEKSDIILKPVRCYKNPFIQEQNHIESYLILCETYMTDKETPHETNHRKNCEKIFNETIEDEILCGIEQEIALTNKDGTPYAWTRLDKPFNNVNEQNGYCGVGAEKIFKDSRKFYNKVMEYCIKAKIHLYGCNFEVANSSMEFVIGTCDIMNTADDLIMLRYILKRTSEEFENLYVSLHPKPFGPLFNGSGCHISMSNKYIRETTDNSEIIKCCEKIGKHHNEYFYSFGDDENKKRLSGEYETASYKEFSYGESNRKSTIRIPIDARYFEFRFPASNLNPYKGLATLAEIINTKNT